MPPFEQGPLIKLGDKVIKRVPHKKTLGVILDEQLKRDKHNEEQSKTISKNFALLRRAKSFVPRHVLEKMYNAFIIPHFYYCSTVWYDGSKNKLTRMSKLQKKAARIIKGDSYDIRSNQVFQKLNWLPMNSHLEIRENIATSRH